VRKIAAAFGEAFAQSLLDDFLNSHGVARSRANTRLHYFADPSLASKRQSKWWKACGYERHCEKKMLKHLRQIAAQLEIRTQP
jgi:hypothetical protein